MPRGDSSGEGDSPGETGAAICAGRGWTVRAGAHGTVVALGGDWIARDGTHAESQAVPRILGAAQAGRIGDGPKNRRSEHGRIAIDSSGLGEWDSALLVFLAALRKGADQHGIALDETGMPDAARRLLALAEDGAEASETPRARLSLRARVGGAVLAMGGEAASVTTIVGETILRSGALPRGGVRMRGIDLLTCVYEAGVAALPVVTVVNVLVGCILAFVGAVQLRKFGADVYVAALVGVGMVREMSALMTAIAMAGRTGGAYAAHIATMRGSEEIDALHAIGIPVFDYLVLPRVLALTCMMPLLYIYGCVVGIFGGFLVAIAMMHTTPAAFIQQTRDSIALTQVSFGLGKSVAFGALIAIAGCRTGLRAGRSSADVGRAATTAVVIGILGVIALDAIFAVCANTLDF